MSFQTPLTIEDMLRSIHEHKYLMPAIRLFTNHGVVGV